MKPGPVARPVEVRFWEKVQKTNECWLWTGTKAKNGYGVLRMNRKTATVHRLSWQLHKGQIPKGKSVCHHCDIRHCVRPDHLFIATQEGNLQDASQKGRLNGRNVGRGERHGNHKLTETQVRQIRAMVGTQTAIAKQFGISRVTISDIKRRLWWKHVV
jgi:hypothetical protein